MSTVNEHVTTEQRIELPDTVVDAIEQELSSSDAPTADVVRDIAFDHLDRRTEFVTEDGEPLVEALQATDDSQ